MLRVVVTVEPSFDVFYISRQEYWLFDVIWGFVKGQIKHTTALLV
jgi:hypothetical protein